MLVIAHRGASAELPENTLAAFERAVEVGADMIEMDLRVSADGVVFIAHDPVAERGPRPAFRELQARAGSSGRYPPLAAVLDRFAARIPLNLELKELAAAPGLAVELERRGLGGSILVSSFDPRATLLVRERCPRVATGCLVRRLPVRPRAALGALGAASLHLGRGAVTPRVIARVHRAGARLFVYTVDDPADQRRLAGLGVDGLFTNDPARAVAWLRGSAALG